MKNFFFVSNPIQKQQEQQQQQQQQEQHVKTVAEVGLRVYNNNRDPMWCQNNPVIIRPVESAAESPSPSEDGDNFSRRLDEILVSTNSLHV